MTSPGKSSPLPLRVHALTRRFGDVVAVDGISLEVRPGEIVGFLGPNGAGKTTTLRVCSGLLRADAGTVEIAGAPLKGDALRAKRQLGFVPDRPFLYERLSGWEFLAFVAALYDVPPAVAEARAEVLIERLDMSQFAHQLIEDDSLGMRQKIAIAAALLHEPALIMLDEPLGGLDPQGARVLKDLLRDRAERGSGVLVSTHLLDVAERMCDRVVILDHGRVRAEGTLATLRGARRDATLEELFLELTRTEQPSESEQAHRPSAGSA